MDGCGHGVHMMTAWDDAPVTRRIAYVTPHANQLEVFIDSEMTNNTDELLKQVLDNTKNGSGNTTVILQGITLALLLFKPVIMYYIQAKYNAPPPHEAIMRNIDDNKETEIIEEEGNTKVFRYNA